MFSRVRLPLGIYLIGLLVLVLGLLGTGCGGGSSSSDPSAGSSGKTNGAAAAKPDDAKAATKAQGKGNPTSATFGREATTAERETAGAVLAENFEARAAADFVTQCATLSIKAIGQIPGVAKSGNIEKACPAALKKLATPLAQTAPARKNTLSGSIYELRVKGDVAQARFHGNDGKNYAILLEREAGTWKVGALVATEA